MNQLHTMAQRLNDALLTDREAVLKLVGHKVLFSDGSERSLLSIMAGDAGGPAIVVNAPKGCRSRAEAMKQATGFSVQYLTQATTIHRPQAKAG